MKKLNIQKCEAEIGVGPGHQSRVKCSMTGQHNQHQDYAGEYFWTKVRAFSGFFDQSPERQGEPNPRRAKRIWAATDIRSSKARGGK